MCLHMCRLIMYVSKYVPLASMHVKGGGAHLYIFISLCRKSSTSHADLACKAATLSLHSNTSHCQNTSVWGNDTRKQCLGDAATMVEVTQMDVRHGS